jgi:SAM-dependent methyltransferase
MTNIESSPRSELDKHWHYLADGRRLEAYARALREVASQAVVLDLGCGTGILGLLACRHGAKRVYAVDRGAILEVARSVARWNGLGDRIVHIRAKSTDVELPEQVDIVVCDQLGPLGPEAGVLTAVPDAVKRLLRPGGTVLPQRFVTSFAPIETTSGRSAIDRWAVTAGFDFTPVRSLAAVPQACTALDVHRLGQAEPVIDVDLASQSGTAWVGRAQWSIRDEGVLDGFQGWFDAWLGQQVLTNAPDAAERINRPSGWLPLETRWEVSSGDLVTLAVTMRGTTIAWTAELWRGGARRLRARHVHLAPALLSREDLARLRASAEQMLPDSAGDL